MGKERTIVFARINFYHFSKEVTFTEKIKKLIDTRIKHEETVRGIGFFWVITGSKELNANTDDHIIFGELNKIRADVVSTVFDEEKWVMKPVPAISGIGESTSRFLIMPKYHIIAFEERMPFISLKRFIDVFTHICAKIVGETAYIIPFTQEAWLYEQIEQFDRVIEVKFKQVRPSNPEDLKAFEEAQKFLKNAGSKTTNIDFINEPDGLNINQNSIIDSLIALSNRGYGDYEIKGVEKETETKKKITKKQGPLKHILTVERLEEFIKRVSTEIKKIAIIKNKK